MPLAVTLIRWICYLSCTPAAASTYARQARQPGPPVSVADARQQIRRLLRDGSDAVSRRRLVASIFPALRRHVEYLIEGGIVRGNGMLLAGGAAGDFSTMTFEERVQVAETVVDTAAGRVSVAMGAQTTSTMELVGWPRPPKPPAST